MVAFEATIIGSFHCQSFAQVLSLCVCVWGSHVNCVIFLRFCEMCRCEGWPVNISLPEEIKLMYSICDRFQIMIVCVAMVLVKTTKIPLVFACFVCKIESWQMRCDTKKTKPYNSDIYIYIAIVFCEAEIVVDGRNSPTFTGSFRICHLSTHDYQSLSHMCLVAWKHQDGRTQANHLGCINLVVNSGKQASYDWHPGNQPSTLLWFYGRPFRLGGSFVWIGKMIIPIQCICFILFDMYLYQSEPQPSWEQIFLSSVGCSDTKNRPFQHISSGLPEASCGF